MRRLLVDMVAGGVGAEDGDLDMWKSAAETYLDDLIASGKLTKGAFKY